ncbi:hypothetical protein QYE76_033363 [Lolium multiflorum]|uniref:TF-B3 domain-containing protein n=1 Tax=Lolium multiflorum TaxID=4521 RepID=A0AAD8QV50_LOLMU|nr:hypothetical protein QYE76_033363 [Lolium multiflorum]
MPSRGCRTPSPTSSPAKGARARCICGRLPAAGKMYLRIGWEKFACYHRLEAGFVLMFSYFGEMDMSVKVFDETCCRRQYHDDSAEEGRGLSVVSSH